MYACGRYTTGSPISFLSFALHTREKPISLHEYARKWVKDRSRTFVYLNQSRSSFGNKNLNVCLRSVYYWFTYLFLEFCTTYERKAYFVACICKKMGQRSVQNFCVS